MMSFALALCTHVAMLVLLILVTKITVEFTEIKVMSQEVYEDRVSAERVKGMLGNVSDTSGSTSIFDSNTGG